MAITPYDALIAALLWFIGFCLLGKKLVKAGLEVGKRLGREEEKKRAEERHGAVRKLLASKVTARLKDVVHARVHGDASRRVLGPGEFAQAWKIPTNLN